MELLLIFFITLGLMVSIVYALRRHQKIQLEQNADRYNPLPPLDEEGRTDLNIAKELEVLGDTSDLLNDSKQPGSDVSLQVIENHLHQLNQLENNPTRAQVPQQTSTVRIIKREPASVPSRAQSEVRSGVQSSTQSGSSAIDNIPKPRPDSVAHTPGFNSASYRSLQVAAETATAAAVSTSFPEAVNSQALNEAVELETLEPLPDPTPLSPPAKQQNRLAKDAQSATTFKKSEIESSVAEPVPAPVPDMADNNARSWQDRVAELKREGQLNEAMAVCEAEYPLWGAYSQASIITRALLKDDLEHPENLELRLQNLYRLAAQAEFLHEKISDNPPLSASQLKKLRLEQLADLEMPYQQIGYLKLRLLKKTDIRILSKQWGEPKSHSSPRVYCADQWQSLLAELQV